MFTCQLIYCQQGIVLALVLYDNQNLLFFVLPIIFTCLCLYLSLNVVNVVNVVNIFQTLVQGCTKIARGECQRHEIWDKEKTIWFGCSDGNWGFQQQHQRMCRCIMAFPLCMHSGFPTKRVEQMIMTS